MDLITAFLFFTFFLLSYFLISSSSTSRPKNHLPPEARGARPLVGHLHLMSGSVGNLPHANLGAVADKIGPIFTIRLASQRVVVVSSWKIAKELFTTWDSIVSDRPKLRASRHLSNNYAVFGFAPYSPYWRDLRKFASIKLLSTRQVDLMGDTLRSETAVSVKEMYDSWERAGTERVAVDLKKWFAKLNLNLILQVVAGKRFDGSEDDGEMWRCVQVISDFFKYAGMFVPADAVAWLRFFDLGGYEKGMKRTAKELDEIMQRWVDEHRRKDRKKTFEDFIDVMVAAADNAEFGDEFDADTIIKSTCQSVILAGSDTTSITLTWALCLLLQNPHILAKAQAELDKHVGRERVVKESDIPNLVYLQCIIKETLRLYPPGPFSTRELREECRVEGYTIPKGTWVIVNLWKLQRDPEVWHDKPDQYNPERFLTSHAHLDVKGQDYEFIPFGAGRRICPGFNLAMHNLYMGLATVLQAFDISTEANTTIDMTGRVGMTYSKVNPLNVLVAPRLAANLY